MRDRPYFFRRLGAGLIDTTLGLLLARLLAPNLGYYFARRAVVMLRIGDPASIWKGPVPMLMGIFGPFVYTVPFALLTVFSIEGLLKASPGKLVVRLRVGPAGTSISAQPRVILRTLYKLSGLWMMVLSLVVGQWQIAVAALLLTACGFAAFLFALGPGRASLYDRLAGTRVNRIGRNDKSGIGI